MVSDTLEKFGSLDGLVNNGGGQFHSAAENISQNGFHAVVDTNLYGTWNCINEAFHQYMKGNLIFTVFYGGTAHDLSIRFLLSANNVSNKCL